MTTYSTTAVDGVQVWQPGLLSTDDRRVLEAAEAAPDEGGRAAV